MILVIGGTGNIGKSVVEGLLGKGQKVRVLARDAKTAGQAFQQAEVVQGDLDDAASLARAMEGAEKLFLVTPLHLDQIKMKSNAIQAAKAAGIKHIAMSTGIGAGPDAGVEIGRWHGESQEEVKATGIPYTFLQPGFFMQNFIMSAPTIIDHGAFYLPLGNGEVSFVDARDIADVAVTALTSRGYENSELPITGGQAITCENAAAIMSDVLGKEVRFVDVTLDQAKEAMVGAGLPEKLADIMNELYALGPAGHLSYVAPTVDEATGHKPRDFRQFFEDHADAFRTN
ncbi:SDR family oxidoreductase [Roseibium aggregatum]|jgi:uncharacterized protein YbjT (DUF2867 family)|uniref:SDR family oxidoreductase n=1 Tax=Roseibium aggregatum TaxID=187304 RepID=UPI001E5CB231|nr:SDR family oxidoreductase [Roseibium aggregatum]UES54057.1 NAD(P)H-binding protein [Roseibium aggregatum]